MQYGLYIKYMLNRVAVKKSAFLQGTRASHVFVRGAMRHHEPRRYTEI
jgi:hypothetical protein